ncbi:hypothetical protein JL100_006660 [Skermanella mucosa]|nr:hypothetical protein [Skermanella mucosa]UEM22423.1 hypothetical protein JL100_006660 [Skermanella mucosa]
MRYPEAGVTSMVSAMPPLMHYPAPGHKTVMIDPQIVPDQRERAGAN